MSSNVARPEQRTGEMEGQAVDCSHAEKPMCVTRLVIVLVLGGAAVTTNEAAAEAADAGVPAPPALPACVQVKTESRYVPYGYNHIVTLTSGCGRPASCTVATDVSPDPRPVDLPANSTVAVTTFMGAASSTFTAKVACKLR